MPKRIVCGQAPRTVFLATFWLKNDFSCIRFGNSKDSSSGSHSLEMIKQLSQKANPIDKLLNQRFNQSFMHKILAELKELDIEVKLSGKNKPELEVIL